MNSVQMSISSSRDMNKNIWDHLCIIFYQQKAPQINFDIYRVLVLRWLITLNPKWWPR